LFVPWKMAIFWLLFVAVFGLGIFKGKGIRLAVWIQGNRHSLNRQASAIRWGLVVAATLMIWQGWRLTMGAASDVLFVALGSFLLVVFLYIPDAAFHLSNGLDRVLQKSSRPQNS
jgi:hypothetical protein